MRRLLTIGCALAVVAMGFMSCNDESDEIHYYTTESSGPTPAVVGFNQLTVSVPAAITLSEGSEFLFEWADQDEISVYEEGGDWVADMVIADAASKTFTVDGDFRFDDDTRYIAVYPQRESIGSSLTSYDDYVVAAIAMSAEQTQIDNTFDHLKVESYMEVEFRGDGAVAFESKKVVTTIAFGVDEGASSPATLKYNDGQDYTLKFQTMFSSKSTSTKTNYVAYMMANPVAASSGEEERTLTFVISDSSETVLVEKELTTTVGTNDGALCEIDVESETIKVTESGDEGSGGDDGGDDGDSYGGSSENLDQNEGGWN